MVPVILRYMVLTLFIILASCSSKQRFKTDNLHPESAVTINVDKRIKFISIDGRNYSFSANEAYPVMLDSKNRNLKIYFETSYKEGTVFRTEPTDLTVDLTKGLNYELFAIDYKDREKLKGYSPKKETFLVHYYLKSDDGKVQSFKTSCSTSKIDIPTIRCLINNNENLDRRYGNNRDIAIIHHVVLNNQKDCLILLIENGADINRKSRAKGYTPLHTAVLKNNLEMVKTLVTKKADINSTDNNSMTPLHIAVSQGNYEIAKYLIKSGAKPDLKDKKGLEPYDYARRGKNKRLLSLFKKKRSVTKIALKKEASSKKVKSKTLNKGSKTKAYAQKKKTDLKKKQAVKKKSKTTKRKKPLYEEDRLPKRENPIPYVECSTQECYASISDRIESALKTTRYSKLETEDLRKVAYIYFQISKLCKRSAPDSAKVEFKKASDLFRSMAFGKRDLYLKRRMIIKSAENHVTSAAKLIVVDAEEKLKVLTE